MCVAAPAARLHRVLVRRAQTLPTLVPQRHLGANPYHGPRRSPYPLGPTASNGTCSSTPPVCWSPLSSHQPTCRTGLHSPRCCGRRSGSCRPSATCGWTRAWLHRPTATLGGRMHQRLDKPLPPHRPPLRNHPRRPRRLPLPQPLPQPNRPTTPQTRPQPVVRHAFETPWFGRRLRSRLADQLPLRSSHGCRVS